MHAADGDAEMTERVSHLTGENLLKYKLIRISSFRVSARSTASIYFSRTQYDGRGFFKRLVLIFSTSLVPLSGWLHPTRKAAACTSPRPPRARLPPSDAAELGRHASNHSIL